RKGKERYTKTDKIDAQLIARELKDGRLDSIVIPEVEREQLRSLFRRRNDLVKDFRRIKSYIKMQLLYLGISIPEEFDNDHWSHNSRAEAIAMVLNQATARESSGSRSRRPWLTKKELREYSTQLRANRGVRNKKETYQSRWIPGVG